MTDVAIVTRLRLRGFTKQEITSVLRDIYKDKSPTYLTRHVERICHREGLTWLPPEPPTTG